MDHARDVSPEVDHLFRTESARLVAVLVRFLGAEHLELAEDVTQDALSAALRHWPISGIPKNPSGWLFQVARRRAMDVLRRERRLERKAEMLAAEPELWSRQIPEDASDSVFEDDQLKLVILCCDPALSAESRVAMTLKLVGGFGVREIARGLLSDEAAIAQRLVRAKRTLRERRTPFELPPVSALAERLEAVLAALYLMFTEGHLALEGEDLLRPDLCQEALRLTALLTRHPATALPEVHALLALFCFQMSRLPARLDSTGQLVPLAEQERGRWDRQLISRGAEQLLLAARGDRVTRYHLEAEIAACHAFAPTWKETDWERIVAGYDRLLALTGSPVSAVHRVVALHHLRGSAAALDALLPLLSEPALADYPPLHSVHGELLYAEGRQQEAERAFRRALSLTVSAPVRAHLGRRLALTGVNVES